MKPQRKPYMLLKALRAKHDLSQENIAEHLGVSQTTYSLKENAKTDFTITEIEKLIKLFKVQYEYIFGNVLTDSEEE